ncbi:hypothetical protein B0T17DRAFT_510892 [Bombardia bombarda]|uniref:Uncharacterized protein n=1 Tax=Bombardia bombarda TaxID=252184 RepID=A0AA40BVF4_9PEZI|nr:hypothetical protein B0T17DRAFT_510892 [Bombardia bombarda]
MRLIITPFLAALAMAASLPQPEPDAFGAEKTTRGVQIWGSNNDIEECDMHQAIQCLHDNICSWRTVSYHSKIRCTIGRSVAYLCNYKSNKGEDAPRGEEPGQHSCDVDDFYEAWRQIRIAKNSETGWWYEGHRPR